MLARSVFLKGNQAVLSFHQVQRYMGNPFGHFLKEAFRDMRIMHDHFIDGGRKAQEVAFRDCDDRAGAGFMEDCGDLSDEGSLFFDLRDHRVRFANLYGSRLQNVEMEIDNVFANDRFARVKCNQVKHESILEVALPYRQAFLPSLKWVNPFRWLLYET